MVGLGIEVLGSDALFRVVFQFAGCFQCVFRPFRRRARAFFFSWPLLASQAACGSGHQFCCSSTSIALQLLVFLLIVITDYQLLYRQRPSHQISSISHFLLSTPESNGPSSPESASNSLPLAFVPLFLLLQLPSGSHYYSLLRTI